MPDGEESLDRGGSPLPHQTSPRGTVRPGLNPFPPEPVARSPDTPRALGCDLKSGWPRLPPAPASLSLSRPRGRARLPWQPHRLRGWSPMAGQAGAVANRSGDWRLKRQAAANSSRRCSLVGVISGEGPPPADAGPFVGFDNKMAGGGRRGRLAPPVPQARSGR